jgi:putative aminopeptidase FrvX
VVSVPLRYMHTPAEVLDLGDLDESVKLMCAYIRRLTPEIDFTPR